MEKQTHGIIYSEGKFFYKKKTKMSMSEAMLSENSIISPIEQQGKFIKQFLKIQILVTCFMFLKFTLRSVYLKVNPIILSLPEWHTLIPNNLDTFLCLYFLPVKSYKSDSIAYYGCPPIDFPLKYTSSCLSSRLAISQDIRISFWIS